MHRILELDQKLTPLYVTLEQVAREVNVPFVCDLVEEAIVATQSYAGIYRIDVSTAGAKDLNTWIDEFRLEWEQDQFKKSWTSNPKKKRIEHHQTLLEWMPLYLGKSKNVGKRVLEHVNLDMSKSTFALKLKARGKWSPGKYRLYALPVPVHNYDLILPALEKQLRDRFQPIIGKQ